MGIMLWYYNTIETHIEAPMHHCSNDDPLPMALSLLVMQFILTTNAHQAQLSPTMILSSPMPTMSSKIPQHPFPQQSSTLQHFAALCSKIINLPLLDWLLAWVQALPIQSSHHNSMISILAPLNTPIENNQQCHCSSLMECKPINLEAINCNIVAQQ